MEQLRPPLAAAAAGGASAPPPFGASLGATPRGALAGGTPFSSSPALSTCHPPPPAAASAQAAPSPSAHTPATPPPTRSAAAPSPSADGSTTGTSVSAILARLSGADEECAKRACFELRAGLLSREAAFLADFSQSGAGVRALVHVVAGARGNLLAYALGALVAWLDVSGDYRNLPTSFMEKLAASVFDPNLNASKNALDIANRLFVQSPGAVIFLKRKKSLLTPQSLAHKMFEDGGADAIVRVQTLTLINNQLSTLDKDERETLEGEYFVATAGALLPRDFLLDEMRDPLARHQKLLAVYACRPRDTEYDPAAHEPMLRRLWAASFDEPWPGAVGAHWKRCGFQGKDPRTDFRATRLLALTHLLHFSERYTHTWRRLLATQDAKPAENQYPVATVGVCLSQTLVETFGVANPDASPPPFLPLLVMLEPDVVPELYCVLFEMIDHRWETDDATYMQFPAVLAGVRRCFDDLLASNLPSLAALRQAVVAAGGLPATAPGPPAAAATTTTTTATASTATGGRGRGGGGGEGLAAGAAGGGGASVAAGPEGPVAGAPAAKAVAEDVPAHLQQPVPPSWSLAQQQRSPGPPACSPLQSSLLGQQHMQVQPAPSTSGPAAVACASPPAYGLAPGTVPGAAPAPSSLPSASVSLPAAARGEGVAPADQYVSLSAARNAAAVRPPSAVGAAPVPSAASPTARAPPMVRQPARRSGAPPPARRAPAGGAAPPPARRMARPPFPARRPAPGSARRPMHRPFVGSEKTAVVYKPATVRAGARSGPPSRSPGLRPPPAARAARRPPPGAPLGVRSAARRPPTAPGAGARASPTPARRGMLSPPGGLRAPPDSRPLPPQPAGRQPQQLPLQEKLPGCEEPDSSFDISSDLDKLMAELYTVSPPAEPASSAPAPTPAPPARSIPQLSSAVVSAPPVSAPARASAFVRPPPARDPPPYSVATAATASAPVILPAPAPAPASTASSSAGGGAAVAAPPPPPPAAVASASSPPPECDRCDEPANVRCDTCSGGEGMLFCRRCTDEVHGRGRWASHRIAPLAGSLPQQQQPSPTRMSPSPWSSSLLAPPRLSSSPSFVQGAEGMDSEKALRLRSKLLVEIFSTEKDYIEGLKVIVEVFYYPMKFKQSLTPEDLQLLFSNVETLLNCNQQLLMDWERRKRESSTSDEIDLLSDIFMNMSPFFKMYTLYCSNQPNVTLVLDKHKKRPEFMHTLRICESDPRCKGLNLYAYLIKPVQRICKYPLFFRDLIKYTSYLGESEGGHCAQLEEVLRRIEEVTQYINEHKRQAEGMQRIVEIQSSIDNISQVDFSLVEARRRFIREGPLVLLREGASADVHAILFSDLLLIAKKKRNMLHGKDVLHVVGHVFFESVRIVNVADTDTLQNVIHLVDHGREFRLQAETPHVKFSWLKEFKALKREFQKRQLMAAS